MRFKQEIRVRAWVVAVALTGSLFGSGRQVFASGQAPGAQPPPGTPATAVAQPAQSGPEMSVGIDEAVRLALENNLGIEAERLTPEIRAFAEARATGVYAPTLFSTFSNGSTVAPPTDFLSTGGDTTTITNGRLFTQAGVQQNLKWGGGNYQVAFDGSRGTSDAPRVIFSPQLGSNFSAQYTQPLLRDFRIDGLRQQILQARNQRQVADIQLQERVTLTSRAVRSAYYSLVGAIGQLAVAQQSLNLARESLRNNQTRVEVGTLAPIDVVEAEAEVARNEESVILAEAAIRTAEDQLRTLVMNPKQPDFWTLRLTPSEQPVVAPQTIDVDAAISNALANRTDLAQLRKQLESTDIDIRFARNQKLPAVDLTARYGVTGVGGTQFRYGSSDIDGLPIVTGSSQRSFSDVLRDVFGNEFRTWSVAINFSYPVGNDSADAALAQGRVARQQLETALRDTEVRVTADVRDAARQVNASLRRVEATRKARELAEKRLEAEEKRMTVGLSTTFQMVQAQRDLAQQRQAELNAIIAYNRALVDFEAVQSVPVR
jgi:outer membrane protein